MNKINNPQERGTTMAKAAANTAGNSRLTRKQVAPPPPPPEVDEDQQYEDEDAPPEIEETQEELSAEDEGDAEAVAHAEVEAETDVEAEPATKAAPAAKHAANQQKATDFIEEQERLLIINADNLNEEFIQHSYRFFKASRNLVKAEAILRQQKDILTNLTAVIDQELRNSGDKVTQGFIETAIKGDVRYQAQSANINKAQMQASTYQSLVQALIHKKDMLIQLGAAIRAEWSSSPQINRTAQQDQPPIKNGKPTRL